MLFFPWRLIFFWLFFKQKKLQGSGHISCGMRVKNLRYNVLLQKAAIKLNFSGVVTFRFVGRWHGGDWPGPEKKNPGPNSQLMVWRDHTSLKNRKAKSEKNKMIVFFQKAESSLDWFLFIYIIFFVWGKGISIFNSMKCFHVWNNLLYLLQWQCTFTRNLPWLATKDYSNTFWVVGSISAQTKWSPFLRLWRLCLVLQKIPGILL